MEFVESPSDKFQILINASYSSEFYNSDDIIKYNLNKHGDSLNIKLVGIIEPVAIDACRRLCR